MQRYCKILRLPFKTYNNFLERAIQGKMPALSELCLAKKLEAQIFQDVIIIIIADKPRLKYPYSLAEPRKPFDGGGP